jgi:hypothetical protein
MNEDTIELILNTTLLLKKTKNMRYMISKQKLKE